MTLNSVAGMKGMMFRACEWGELSDRDDTLNSVAGMKRMMFRACEWGELSDRDNTLNSVAGMKGMSKYLFFIIIPYDIDISQKHC